MPKGAGIPKNLKRNKCLNAGSATNKTTLAVDGDKEI
jgi:hypothetical protein